MEGDVAKALGVPTEAERSIGAMDFHRSRRAIATLLVAFTLLSISAIGGLVAAGRTAAVDDAVEGSRFSLTRFELESFFNRWLGSVGDWAQGRDTSGSDANVAVARYFLLREEIAALPPRGTAAATSEAAERRGALVAERERLENQVERTLERRIAEAARGAGLARPLPLFGDQLLLWPPVDVELRAPPRVLAVSPRDEIRLLRTVLLLPGLSDEAIARIEAAVEAGGELSAFVDTIGGVAAFPAIVRDSRTYASTVSTIAHEWAHHYLYFFPLGRAFFESDALRTINESVADIVGEELGAMVIRDFPLETAPAPGVSAVRERTDPILNALRLEIDALFAAGEVAEAERRMAEVRDELETLGRPFRRLNQGFFAFNGIYGNSAASSSPLPPLLIELRARSASLDDFLRRVRDVDSVAELNAALAMARE